MKETKQDSEKPPVKSTRASRALKEHQEDSTNIGEPTKVILFAI